MDEDQEIQLNHPFHRPFFLASEIALPHGGCVSLKKLRPSVWMVMGFWAQACLYQDVFNGLARDSVPESP